MFQKCLTLTDRGYTFRLVKSYMEHIKADESRTLFDYKFTFLQILCSHEHYVAFNLPVTPNHLSKTRSAGKLHVNIRGYYRIKSWKIVTRIRHFSE